MAEATLFLHDIADQAAPEYPAAPQLTAALLDIALTPGQPGCHRALGVLEQLTAPFLSDAVPGPWDLALWRDEVAWLSSVDVDTARQRYAQWLAGAPDERERRRLHRCWALLQRDDGPRVLATELAVQTTIAGRATRILPLLEHLRPEPGEHVALAGSAAHLLACCPESAVDSVPALLDASTRVLRELPTPDDRKRAGAGQMTAALSLLAHPDDTEVVDHLRALLDEPDQALDAAVGLAGLLGPDAGDDVAAVLEAADPMQQEPWSWPVIKESGDEPALAAYLMLGRAGPPARRLRAGLLGYLVAEITEWDESGAGLRVLLADTFTDVLGPRGSGPVGPDALDGAQLAALRTVAECPATVWADPNSGPGLRETLSAWNLPADRRELRALVGLGDDTDATSGGGRSFWRRLLWGS